MHVDVDLWCMPVAFDVHSCRADGGFGLSPAAVDPATDLRFLTWRTSPLLYKNLRRCALSLSESPTVCSVVTAGTRPATSKTTSKKKKENEERKKNIFQKVLQNKCRRCDPVTGSTGHSRLFDHVNQTLFLFILHDNSTWPINFHLLPAINMSVHSRVQPLMRRLSL